MSRFLTMIALSAALAGFGLAAWAPAGAQEKFKFAFVSHGSIQYPYFVKLKKGMEDACEQVKAECQFVEIVNIANIEEQLRALETVLVKGVDGIVIPLINDDIFDEPIQRAIDQGIPVLTATVDDTEGAAGNARLAFIGGNLPQTGYTLTEALSEFFPAEGDVHVLLGIQAFDQTWAIQRSDGIKQFLEEYKAANTRRQVTWDEIETGIDAGVISSRVAAYVQKNPQTTAYIDVGFFHASAAVGLREIGHEPGDVLLAGFDAVQMVLDEMKTGYIQVSISPPAYLEGYLPIIQLDLMKRIGVQPWDVDTGQGLFYPTDVPHIEALVQAGLR